MIRYKILLVGPAGVGKSSLLAYLVHCVSGKIYNFDNEISVIPVSINIDNKKVDLAIWDFYGETNGVGIDTSFIAGDAFIFVFDLSRPETIKEFDTWRLRIENFNSTLPYIIIGNKSDIEKDEIITDKKYIKTSIKTGDNILHAFREIAKLFCI